MMRSRVIVAMFVLGGFGVADLAAAQGGARSTPGVRRPTQTAQAPVEPAPAAGVTAAPADYVIGADDVLTVSFWRDKDMSGDVVVRPDGKITLPLLNDLDAAGLTPEQLRVKVSEAASRYIEEPAATVTVKQINSRKVYITGEVGRPGPYPLTVPTTVLQLISLAGGLSPFAKKDEIVVIRNEAGKQLTFPFDYSAVTKRKKLNQNIVLKPGDSVLVP